MQIATIDDVIDGALDLLERDAPGVVGDVAAWVVENLVHELDVYSTGIVATCDVNGYEVCRVGEQIAVSLVDPKVMDANAARKLATALLRAAEAADQVT